MLTKHGISKSQALVLTHPLRTQNLTRTHCFHQHSRTELQHLICWSISPVFFMRCFVETKILPSCWSSFKPELVSSNAAAQDFLFRARRSSTPAHVLLFEAQICFPFGCFSQVWDGTSSISASLRTQQKAFKRMDDRSLTSAFQSPTSSFAISLLIFRFFCSSELASAVPVRVTFSIF